MTAIWRYRYPEAVLADHAEHVREVKRLTAVCGRTLYDAFKHDAARRRLRSYLDDVETCLLRYWAQVVMIDPRWCGASGTGAYWAVASRCVNEIARDILRERGAGRPAFEVIEIDPGDEVRRRRRQGAMT